MIKFTNSCDNEWPFVLTIFQKLPDSPRFAATLTPKGELKMFGDLEKIDFQDLIQNQKLKVDNCDLELYKVDNFGLDTQNAGEILSSQDVLNEL